MGGIFVIPFCDCYLLFVTVEIAETNFIKFDGSMFFCEKSTAQLIGKCLDERACNQEISPMPMPA